MHADSFFSRAFLFPFRFRRKPNTLPPYPRLLVNAEGIAALKQRIAAAAWASSSWNQLKARAERDLKKPIELPPRGGNWSHNYVCPEHGARLRQGKTDWPVAVGTYLPSGQPRFARRSKQGDA